MGSKIRKFIQKLHIQRSHTLMLIFIFMSLILVRRLFQLQIIQGKTYISTFKQQTTKNRKLLSTRGNIYDRDGNVLAHNELAYTLTLEDNGSYESTYAKNLKMNSMLYKLIHTLRKNGDVIDRGNFHIKTNARQDGYEFDINEGFNLNRFRADIFGYPLIDDMKPEEANAEAIDIMTTLCEEDHFNIANGLNFTYTEEEQEKYHLPESFNLEDALEIAIIRYELSNNRFMKYMAVTVATDISEETVASVKENRNIFVGLEVVEDSVRVYEEHESLGPIIGYTGRASAEELADLRETDDSYGNNAIVGKSGLEQTLESTLKGKDGHETVSVDNMGKVVSIDNESIEYPVAGNDVYLTIKKDWQEDIYEILKQRVAGILGSKIVPEKTFDKTEIMDTLQIVIPVYDCYYQLLNNNIVSIEHFAAPDASAKEKEIYQKFLKKQDEVFQNISIALNGDGNTILNDEPQEMQDYMNYIASTFLMDTEGILSYDMLDTMDDTYKQWGAGTISLQHYLSYLASQNWLDIQKLNIDSEYLDSNEIYGALAVYLEEHLRDSLGFNKIIYKYMLQEDRIGGRDVCICLYEQGVLPKDDIWYEGLKDETMDPYPFILEKVNNLQLEPAMFALDPCSASAVVIDIYSGEVLACVSYPGYNNNKLSKNFDQDYYAKVSMDLSSPFYNKATQQRTAPGSTFKLVSTIAGVQNGVLDLSTRVTCPGYFDKVQPTINCWNKYGCGELDISTAIEQSCNVFFNTIGYNIGLDDKGKFSESVSLNKLQETASQIAMDQKTGIELYESLPTVSDTYAVPSYMGQGTNLYTTTQLARYAGMLANSGTAYKLTLVDRIADPIGNVIEDSQPEVAGHVDLDPAYWKVIHDGMRRVITNSAIFSTLEVSAAGKTGTAQEQTDRPDHGLFIGYAPFVNPQYAIAVRVANGYSSGNVCYIADDIFKYIFSLKDRKSIINGIASSETSNVRTN